ncbi:hypothetical protein Tdes44962_MAKER08580 [Teratosphaeria destructans]|uniref:Uncharacterized protein n=1 Tax=Teratosphaeria destructans TaxID=418781 RepID=A0A9W7W4F2_9PEZI|nr:hypothetical protein Tdes44962_MAKER08580 [Teratosphaeria destructans]
MSPVGLQGVELVRHQSASSPQQIAHMFRVESWYSTRWRVPMWRLSCKKTRVLGSEGNYGVPRITDFGSGLKVLRKSSGGVD